MTGVSRWLVAVPFLVPALMLTGCSTPDSSPVPTTAATPYVCDGVPQQGAKLALGGDATLDEQSGSWTARRPDFACTVDGSGGRRLQVDVRESSSLGASEDEARRALGEVAGVVPIEADGPGGGFVTGPGAGPTSYWVCGDVFVQVALDGDAVKGRDGAQDVTNLVVSMLPWACRGADVPAAT